MSKKKSEIKDNKEKKKEIEEENTTKVEKKEDKELEKKLEEEKTKELKMDTTAVSFIDTKDLRDLINEDLGRKKTKKIKSDGDKSFVLLHSFLILVIVVSLILLGIIIFNSNSSVNSLISGFLLTTFVIVFGVVSITYNRSRKTMVAVGGFLLFLYLFFGIYQQLSMVKTPTSNIPDFRGKNITEVIQWADKKHIIITQDYEYSDFMEEYFVIYQSVPNYSSKVQEINVSVSEGPNPSKEIILPSMISWDATRVINYVHDNYLSNVQVEFVESDKVKDTVIEQNVSGNFRRNEELKLVFSKGENTDNDEVAVIDFKEKSKFEVEFFMKQNGLQYEFLEEYDDKVKKGYAFKQSVEAGKVIHARDEKIVITLSKGPEITVPDLTKYDLSKATKWAIENKIKINFSDQYDDTVPENGILSANYHDGDLIEQGTVVRVVLSRGPLKMPKIASLNDFYSWANKYGIPYEEKHEFHDSIPSGDIIQFSYKTGEVIKNGDSVVVTISDGLKKSVPNLKGLSKNEAISKLEKAGISYNLIYRNSDNISKNYVINQSISAGSEISNNTTISVTISTGKKEQDSKENESEKENNSGKQNSEKQDNNSNNNNNNNSDNQENKEEEEEKPVEKTCNACPRISPGIISNAAEVSKTCSDAASTIKTEIANQCPGITVNVECRDADGFGTNDFIEGFSGGTMYNGEPLTSCSSIKIVLGK